MKTVEQVVALQQRTCQALHSVASHLQPRRASSTFGFRDSISGFLDFRNRQTSEFRQKFTQHRAHERAKLKQSPKILLRGSAY